MSESFFNEIVGVGSATLLKKRLRHSCYPVKFLATHFLQNTLRRLHLPPSNLILSLLINIRFFGMLRGVLTTPLNIYDGSPYNIETSP